VDGSRVCGGAIIFGVLFLHHILVVTIPMMMNVTMSYRYCLAPLVLLAAVGNLVSAFVVVPFSYGRTIASSSSFLLHAERAAPSTSSSSSHRSSYYSTYGHNAAEAFREQIDRPVPNMPGANPNYRPGGKDLESFREQDRRGITNMPGANPNYRPGGRDLETFRERDRTPNMPGGNANYRPGGHDLETFRERDRTPNMPGGNPNYRPGGHDLETFRERDRTPTMIGATNNRSSRVINGQPTLYNNNDKKRENYYGVNSSSPSRSNVYSNYSTAAEVAQTKKDDNNSNPSASSYLSSLNSATAAVTGTTMLVDTNDDDWVDRELVSIRRMGRLAMERELYNTYRAVAQPLPPLNDATTDEELACYLLKARLLHNDTPVQQSNSNNSQKLYAAPNQHYENTKYPSYYKGSVPRSWVDGAHIYGPQQAIARTR
jgi:hypothetical protein